MENDRDVRREYVEEPPPILTSWKLLYFLVALNLAVLICLFYVFTKYFD